MKRTEMPPRKTPLRARRPWQPVRQRLKQRSRKQQAKDREYAQTRQVALERDDWTCGLVGEMDGHQCSRWLPPETHHKLPRSRGGSHDPGGLVTVCRAAHDWIDANPREAELFGFLVSDKWRAIREVEEEQT